MTDANRAGLRSSALALLLGAALLAAAPAPAQDPAAGVVEQLRAQGYEEFEVSRTLLGRVRVLALRPEGTREIVFNPATGEILRDLWTPASGEAAAPRVIDRGDDGPEGGASGPGGGGSGGPGPDDGPERGPGGGPGGDGNRGHGNDADGDDEDNPGRGQGNGRNGDGG